MVKKQAPGLGQRGLEPRLALVARGAPSRIRTCAHGSGEHCLVGL
jgi:hypothetical protein